MKSNKKRFVLVLLILAAITFLSGFFIPRYFLEYRSIIVSILLSIFGIGITMFIFLQGNVRDLKNNILNKYERKQNSKDKIDVESKFKELDEINNELMGDLRITLCAILIYVVLILFFLQISNVVFQEILAYIQYLLFAIIVLAFLDLIQTMFTLIKSCSILHISLMREKDEND